MTALLVSAPAAASPVAVTGDAVTTSGTENSVKALPSLRDFSIAIINGDPSTVVGVYVNNVMALPIIQQPAGNVAYVSTQPEVVTEFRFARQYRTVGLLAHNYLAGEHFFDIAAGQIVTLVYGDGSLAVYRVYEMQRYQALSPNSPYSNFRDLNDTSSLLTSTDVFMRTYGKGDRLVLQTCIQEGSELSWGRLFILAEPFRDEAPPLNELALWDLQTLLSTEYTVAV